MSKKGTTSQTVSSNAKMLYLKLLYEVKQRADLVATLCNNQQAMPYGLVHEMCFLQLRFLCEIISLMCLVAHGDIPDTSVAYKDYEPHKIMRLLTRLHEGFYPQPTTVTKSENQVINVIANSVPVFRSKAELLTLWGKSGDVLHRTPMVKAVEKPVFQQYNEEEILKWLNKILGTVACHSIVFKDPQKRLWVAGLRSEDTGNPFIMTINYVGGNNLHVDVCNLNVV